jgi:nucleoid-associated protein YgaU
MLTIIQAYIQRLTPAGAPDGAPFPVQFNPTEYTLHKGAQIAEIPIPGLDQPIQQFVRGQTETMSVDLFFDSTDASGTGYDATSVTEKTDKFYQLIKIDNETHAPPVLQFLWGQDGFAGANFSGHAASQSRANGFQCIVESVKQRFTFFSSTGIPLRATLSLSLREFYSLEDQIDRINFHSPDQTHSYVVQRGDTLARIAASIYDDPAQWRAIAKQNNLTDPLDLIPGVILNAPPIV